jgi:tyrosyl-tRNA synthetase
VGGSVWLDPARTSPYQFRQFWVQVEDEMVGTYLRMLSMRPLDEIEALLAEQAAAPERRSAQRALADELTALVHGAAAARDAAEAAAVLFGGDPTQASAAALATVAREVTVTEVHDPAELDALPQLLVRTGLCSSLSDARRTLDQRGISANGAKLDPGASLKAEQALHGRFILLRKGRATYHVLVLPSRVDGVEGAR